MSKYGRDDVEWDSLTDAGLEFLTERARLGMPASYSEMNHFLSDRTSLRPFDFDREDERAALGYLLFLIVERNRPSTSLMISAMVTYLNSNDPGPGFVALARELGELPRTASADERATFWARQVTVLHEVYR